MESISIALACTVIGVVISYIALQKTKDDSIKITGREEATTATKLDYISKGVDDIRLDMREQGRQIVGINERLIRVEESVKTAHKKIEDLEKEGER